MTTRGCRVNRGCRRSGQGLGSLPTSVGEASLALRPAVAARSDFDDMRDAVVAGGFGDLPAAGVGIGDHCRPPVSNGAAALRCVGEAANAALTVAGPSTRFAVTRGAPLADVTSPSPRPGRVFFSERVSVGCEPLGSDMIKIGWICPPCADPDAIVAEHVAGFLFAHTSWDVSACGLRDSARACCRCGWRVWRGEAASSDHRPCQRPRIPRSEELSRVRPPTGTADVATFRAGVALPGPSPPHPSRTEPSEGGVAFTASGTRTGHAPRDDPLRGSMD